MAGRSPHFGQHVSRTFDGSSARSGVRVDLLSDDDESALTGRSHRPQPPPRVTPPGPPSNVASESTDVDERCIGCGQEMYASAADGKSLGALKTFTNCGHAAHVACFATGQNGCPKCSRTRKRERPGPSAQQPIALDDDTPLAEPKKPAAPRVPLAAASASASASGAGGAQASAAGVAAMARAAATSGKAPLPPSQTTHAASSGFANSSKATAVPIGDGSHPQSMLEQLKADWSRTNLGEKLAAGRPHPPSRSLQPGQSAAGSQQAEMSELYPGRFAPAARAVPVVQATPAGEATPAVQVAPIEVKSGEWALSPGRVQSPGAAPAAPPPPTAAYTPASTPALPASATRSTCTVGTQTLLLAGEDYERSNFGRFLLVWSDYLSTLRQAVVGGKQERWKLPPVVRGKELEAWEGALRSVKTNSGKACLRARLLHTTHVQFRSSSSSSDDSDGAYAYEQEAQDFGGPSIEFFANLFTAGAFASTIDCGVDASPDAASEAQHAATSTGTGPSTDSDGDGGAPVRLWPLFERGGTDGRLLPFLPPVARTTAEWASTAEGRRHHERLRYVGCALLKSLIEGYAVGPVRRSGSAPGGFCPLPAAPSPCLPLTQNSLRPNPTSAGPRALLLRCCDGGAAPIAPRRSRRARRLLVRRDRDARAR